MQNVFTDYPDVIWKAGWRFSAAPGDPCPLVTGRATGEVTTPESTWSLQLLDPDIPVRVCLLSNGLFLCERKRKSSKQIEAVFPEPGVLSGRFRGLPPPVLSAPEAETPEPGLTRITCDSVHTVLLCSDSRFALVTGAIPEDLALLKAQETLEENFDALLEAETQKRLRTAQLFSINPRHNPPVALAAESLRQRLRGRTAALHGLWSVAEGTGGSEAFSLNELYPLVQAWCLIEPDTALALVQTALSLQQPAGGFPAWVNEQGAVSSAPPWPLIIQSFELAIQHAPNPALLKKSLPALRKYMQWALRRFDPHRDLIPAWQSEQEVFVPNSFERGKATPDLTVLLINELEALQRLYAENDPSGDGAILTTEHDQLAQTLTTVFWNPEIKTFSNVWKDGHTLHEPSFASFMPLLWPQLPAEFKTPLIESFEETHGFPGQADAASWKKEKLEDTAHLPVIHQFMALQALRNADNGRALLMLFVRRTREGFAAWFERESIEAARLQDHHGREQEAAYTLGPVTAALLINAQSEFQHEARKQAPARKALQRIAHRMRFAGSDLKIVVYTLLAMLIAHLLYAPAARLNETHRMAEAALHYGQGQFSKALDICRRYPENAMSRFLRANLLMLAEYPDQAEPLYYEALLQEIESPSALFGYALSLQMNGKFEDAMKRYNDFLDIYEVELSGGPSAYLIQSAYEFMRLAENEFRKPPGWKQVYALAIMQELRL